MKRVLLGIVWIAGLALPGCGKRSDDPPPAPPAQYRAEMARTSYGVAHIRADNFRGLGYGLAYSYAQDNVCMFADTLLTVRGERSMFFGPAAHATATANGEYGAASDFMDVSNEESDFFFKGYLDPAELKAGYAAGSQEVRDLLAGYAAGYNRYLRDHAGKLPSACAGAAWVRPVTVEDMYLVLAEKALHASGEVFAKEIVAAARDVGALTLAQHAGKPDPGYLHDKLARLHLLGSNGLALGKELTASGRGILLGNPHYPWTSTDRFYQAHLTVPGRYDAMGVILGGIPLVVIGFNKDVAWTHTVTTAVHFTTFKLALDPGDTSGTTYLFDGAPQKMSSRTVSVDIKQSNGTLARKSKTFYASRQGAVMVKPEAGIAWTGSSAFVLADPNRYNTRLLDQWLGLGTARSVGEMRAALDKTAGLPWINTVAADRDGNTLYADASVVPHVDASAFASDCFVFPALLGFDGARTNCAWGNDAGLPLGIFAPANGPSLMHGDYVGNSNDSYWLTNPGALLVGPVPLGFSPLYGRTGVEQMLRTRIGFKQLGEVIAQNKHFNMREVQELAFANRVYAAELILPELLGACQGTTDATLAEACVALSAWDKHANLDSRGAVLFREFWNDAAMMTNKWAVPLDPLDPVNTPRGLNPAASAGMLAKLKAAALKLQGLGIALNARLGDYQDDTRNGVRVALHGAIGDIDGSYNSIHLRTALDARGYHDIAWGTSYVQTVTFDNSGPVAQAMLVYGQSTDPKSPHYADQLPLYSQKQWPVLPFSEDAIRADLHYTSMNLFE
ncbi:MAG: penicillin acylase family protein [Pseudomonadota bacterium]